MATNPERFYFISNNRLAIVEKNGTTTVDGHSTAYKTISEAKPLKIFAISKADHFSTGAATDSDEYASSIAGPLGDIPSQFHEALVYKIISMGYKTPPNMQLEVAQFFDMEYMKSVKEAKKYARRNFTQTGMIVPQEF
tara:strand:+ start:597 stop:1010 length:414 start_codon:yes stop_codon:yes gene_type:complete